MLWHHRHGHWDDTSSMPGVTQVCSWTKNPDERRKWSVCQHRVSGCVNTSESKQLQWWVVCVCVCVCVRTRVCVCGGTTGSSSSSSSAFSRSLHAWYNKNTTVWLKATDHQWSLLKSKRSCFSEVQGDKVYVPNLPPGKGGAWHSGNVIATFQLMQSSFSHPVPTLTKYQMYLRSSVHPDVSGCTHTWPSCLVTYSSTISVFMSKFWLNLMLILAETNSNSTTSFKVAAEE